jgi:WD40 repeat protein
LTFCDWFAGATQVKWNRQDSHVVASSHDKYLKIWDDRKGAYPLRYIEAHDTKIYGLDWNRIRATHVVTCSLDKTIKFWDTLKEDDEPDRIIRTAFPVWRARHTPFGWGMLAMPQRGDNNLHLYDRRVAEGTPLDYAAPPAHRFEGHKNHVKEFLWRPRGTIDSNADGRDFQLVSWGADRILRLHHVDSGILAGVGHEKGIKPPGNIIVTRKNVTYKTFREDPLEPGSKIAKGTNVSQLSETLHQRLRQPEGPKHTTRKDTTPKTHPVSGEWERGGFLSSKPGMHNRAAAARKDIDPISWMKGVKIGKCESGMDHTMASISSPSFRADRNWDDFDSLGEEITDVGAKFSKIHFYKVNLKAQQARGVKLWAANPLIFRSTSKIDL